MGATLNNTDQTIVQEFGYLGASGAFSIPYFPGVTNADMEALSITTADGWLHIDWIETGFDPLYSTLGLVFIVSTDYRFDPHGPFYRTGSVSVTDGSNTWTYTIQQRQFPDAFRADTYPFCNDAEITLDCSAQVPPGGMTITPSVSYDSSHCTLAPSSYTISAIPPYYPNCGEEGKKQFLGTTVFPVVGGSGYVDFYTHRVWVIWIYVRDIFGYYRASGHCVVDQLAEAIPCIQEVTPSETIEIPAASETESHDFVLDIVVETNSPYCRWHLYNGDFHTACFDEGQRVASLQNLSSGNFWDVRAGPTCDFFHLDGQGTQTVRIIINENTTATDNYYYLFFGNIVPPDDPAFVQCTLVVIHQLPAEPPPPPEGKPGGVTLVWQRRGYYIAYVDVSMPLRMDRYSSADGPVESVFTIDADTQVAEPRLAAHPSTGVLCLVYRKSDGWYRKVSWDRGVTWISDPLEGGPFRQVAHLREIFNPRTGERLDLYTDANGLLQVDIFDAAERFIGTFPEGASGVLGDSIDNASFEALFLGEDRSSEIHVVFYAGGERRRFRSVDAGRTWSDLAS